MRNVITGNNFVMDTSTVDAFSNIAESSWGFNAYSVKREYVMKCSADDIFDYFRSVYEKMMYKTFYGTCTYFWDDNLSIQFRGTMMEPASIVNKHYDDGIIFSGRYEEVRRAVREFDEHFKNLIVPDHHIVDMIVDSAHGLDKITLPIKTDRKFYPELYPTIPNPSAFIREFLQSTANVLILMGPPGLGKSALINEIILSAGVPTRIVFDKEVMKKDQLYTNFISSTLREGGGLMIMEDADTVLGDRFVENNETMSRLLNLSDGIVDTSGAKFVFSANIAERNQIDSALMRPGRCFDVVEFRNLTLDEARVAAKAIGRELYTEDKHDYTVAEIFNGKTNRKEKMRVGF